MGIAPRSQRQATRGSNTRPSGMGIAPRSQRQTTHQGGVACRCDRGMGGRCTAAVRGAPTSDRRLGARCRLSLVACRCKRAAANISNWRLGGAARRCAADVTPLVDTAGYDHVCIEQHRNAHVVREVVAMDGVLVAAGGRATDDHCRACALARGQRLHDRRRPTWEVGVRRAPMGGRPRPSGPSRPGAIRAGADRAVYGLLDAQARARLARRADVTADHVTAGGIVAELNVRHRPHRADASNRRWIHRFRQARYERCVVRAGAGRVPRRPLASCAPTTWWASCTSSRRRRRRGRCCAAAPPMLVRCLT